MLILVSTTLICLLIAEIGVRKLYGDQLYVWKDERNLVYRYDSELGWFPIDNSTRQFKGNRLINVKHNSRGFRDDEHLVSTNPRMIFLGDSFVWGYDVEQSERFTEILKKRLSNWTVYNLGVSGYGTDQEYLLLQRHYDFYKPDIVFLVFCADNDEDDNTQNMRYGGYYKPYFKIKEKTLELRGTPVPKSENYFFVKYDILTRSYLARLILKEFYKMTNPPLLEIENPTFEIINKFYELSKTNNFHFLMGIQGESPELELFLKGRNIPYVSLANSLKYPSHGNHWTPQGHAIVAERINNFLIDNSYLLPETASN